MAWKKVWGVYASLPSGDDLRETLSQQALVEVSQVLAKTMTSTKQLDTIRVVLERAHFTIGQAVSTMQNQVFHNNTSAYLNAIVRTRTLRQANRMVSALNADPRLSWKLYPDGIEFFSKYEDVDVSGIVVEDVNAWLTTRRNGITDVPAFHA